MDSEKRVGPRDLEERRETGFKTLTAAQDQVRFADAKVAVVATFNLFIFGFTATQMPALMVTLRKGAGADPCTSVLTGVVLASLFLGYFGFAVASFLNIIASVCPRLGKGTPSTMLFFKHIAETYGRDYGRFQGAFKVQQLEELVDQIGSQILEVSNIALEKHQLVARATTHLIRSLGFWISFLMASNLVVFLAPGI